MIKLNIKRFANGTIYGTDNGKLRGRIVWSSTTDAANNRSLVTISIQASKTSNTSVASTGRLMAYSIVTEGLNDTGNASKTSGEWSITKNEWTTVKTAQVYVSHNSDGSKSIAISGYVNGPSDSSLANVRVTIPSTTVTLDKIARGTSVTSFTCTARTETTATFSWKADATVDYLWYSLNDGSFVGYDTTDGTSGTFQVTGLTSDKQYNIKIKVRRKDSQVQSAVTNNISFKTYAYPTITNISTQTLVIGSTQTITLSNPLNRSVTINAIVGGTNVGAVTTTGTSVTITPNANTVYTTLQKAETANITYQLVYGSYTHTKTGVIDNIPVVITSQEWKRAAATSNTVNKITIKGNFFNGNLGSYHNALTIQYKYKFDGGSETSYTNICSGITASNSDVTISGHTFTVNKAITITTPNYSTGVTITVRVADSKVSNEYTYKITRGLSSWWWTNNYLAVRDTFVIGSTTLTEAQLKALKKLI